VHKTPPLTAEILDAARLLWDFLKLDHDLRKSDCIIAMGSHDLRVAQYAAQLMLAGWAPVMVCSGSLGRLTRDIWHETEAEKFAEIALKQGVPADKLLLEKYATNTGENILFTRRLLTERGMQIRSAILVHKPYMERRAYATAVNFWANVVFTATSPPASFDTYATPQIPLSLVIEAMVGDFERVMRYPQKGYQIPQSIPQEILVAYKFLLNAGFTRFAGVEQSGAHEYNHLKDI